MATDTRLTLLRQILAGKVVLTLFVWGLPALLAPVALFCASAYLRPPTLPS